MTNEIIFVNPNGKPTRPTPAPIPEAPAEASAPQVKRIRIGWGEEGRKEVAARSAEQSNAFTDGRVQPQRGLVKVRRTVSPESRSFSEAPPRIEMRHVERYSKLEQIRGQRLLSETLAERTEQSALEHLTILHSQNAQKYWIADIETGKVFLPQVFITLQHCHEAAAELERTFDMAQVVMLRPPETLERMETIALAAVWRETVELAIA